MNIVKRPRIQTTRLQSRIFSESSEKKGELGVETCLRSVNTRIEDAIKARVEHGGPATVRLVAVSKTKPASDILAAYNAGQRDFGENYVQELVEKACHPDLACLDDLCYHFIGKLQSNKVNALVKKVPQLAMIETLDSLKLAMKIDSAVKAAAEVGIRPDGPLKVMVQVNSSGEPQKGGVETIDEAVTLAQDITQTCPNLDFVGVMTIGNADYTAGPANFQYLADCRQAVADALDVDEGSLELSMGMSGDFEPAIMHGSTNVRVGSTIFGNRVYDK